MEEMYQNSHFDIIGKDISRMVKDLDLCEVHGPVEIFPYVLKKCTETSGRPLKCYSKNHWKRDWCQGKGGEQIIGLMLRKIRKIYWSADKCV